MADSLEEMETFQLQNTVLWTTTMSLTQIYHVLMSTIQSLTTCNNQTVQFQVKCVTSEYSVEI